MARGGLFPTVSVQLHLRSIACVIPVQAARNRRLHPIVQTRTFDAINIESEFVGSVECHLVQALVPSSIRMLLRDARAVDPVATEGPLVEVDRAMHRALDVHVEVDAVLGESRDIALLAAIHDAAVHEVGTQSQQVVNRAVFGVAAVRAHDLIRPDDAYRVSGKGDLGFGVEHVDLGLQLARQHEVVAIDMGHVLARGGQMNGSEVARSTADVFYLVDGPDARRVALGEVLHDGSCVVGGRIVAHDDLEVEVGLLVDDALQARADVGLLVVGDDAHRHLGRARFDSHGWESFWVCHKVRTLARIAEEAAAPASSAMRPASTMSAN